MSGLLFSSINLCQLSNCRATASYPLLLMDSRSLNKGGMIPGNSKSYVCIHVFERTWPVLLISRERGQWCFLCGGDREGNASNYRVVASVMCSKKIPVSDRNWIFSRIGTLNEKMLTRHGSDSVKDGVVTIHDIVDYHK